MMNELAQRLNNMGIGATWLATYPGGCDVWYTEHVLGVVPADLSFVDDLWVDRHPDANNNDNDVVWARSGAQYAYYLAGRWRSTTPGSTKPGLPGGHVVLYPNN